MPLALGPIVGHTTPTTAKIWARALADDGPLCLRYAAAAGEPRFDPVTGAFAPVRLASEVRERPLTIAAEPFPIASETLDGLTPNTRYFYEIVGDDGERRPNAMVCASPPSFRTLPDQPQTQERGGLRFAFLSCNGLQARPSGKAATAMWRRLIATALLDPRVRFAILGGDQVYADSVRDTWLATYSRSEALSVDEEEALRRDLTERYGGIYLAWWRRPAIRTLMAHLPCVMTWDDHEIYDGWGSHGDEELPAQRAFFAAAAAAFDSHQMVHNPPGSGLDRGQGHRAFRFRVGEVGFLVLDLRSCRRAHAPTTSALLGEAQWGYVAETLAQFERQGVRQLVVVTSVPPVFTDRWICDTPRFLVGDNHDDLMDQWGSPANRNDQLRLFGRLFAFRRETGANVLILGGDIHVATVGAIHSRAPEHLRPGESVATIHQGVSSAIAYKPVRGAVGALVAAHAKGDHAITEAIDGVIDKVHLARNFAIVSAVAEQRAFWFELHLEGLAIPQVVHFPGRAAASES